MAEIDKSFWYNRQPRWVRILLLPIVFPGMIISGICVITVLAFLIPYACIRGWIGDFRFYRKLRRRGQLAQSQDLQSLITKGNNTLIIEMCPKGPGYSWIVPESRDAIDPEHIIPTIQQYTDQNLKAFFESLHSDSVREWAEERLGAFETNAVALPLKWKQIVELADEIKSNVIVIPDFSQCLSYRLRKESV